MAFIRIKIINNSPYAYLVESRNTKSGPRQKVKKYLGRVHEPLSDSNEIHLPEAETKKEFISFLIQAHLRNHGFEDHDNHLVHNKLVFCPRRNKLHKKTKDQVIALNEGHLSNFTINRLLRFNKTKDLNKDAAKLAKYFLEAGLPVSEEQFIEFYQLL